MTSSARLGPLPTLEVERLHPGKLVPAKPKPPRGQFVEIPRVGRLLFGQHAALARANAGAGKFGPLSQRHLCRGRQCTETHIGHQQRDGQMQWLGRIRPDDNIGADRIVVEQGRAEQLRRQ